MRPRNASGVVSCRMVLQLAWNVIWAKPTTTSVAAAIAKVPAIASVTVPAEARRPAVTGSAIGGRPWTTSASVRAPAIAPPPRHAISQPKSPALPWSTCFVTSGTSTLKLSTKKLTDRSRVRTKRIKGVAAAYCNPPRIFSARVVPAEGCGRPSVRRASRAPMTARKLSALSRKVWASP